MSKILWLSWKDIRNPQAGGAEVVGHEIRKRFARDGHEVLHLTSAFNKSAVHEDIDGVETIRLRSPRIFLLIKTFFYYRKYLRGKFDIIIEEVNTSPYLANLYKKDEKIYLLYHQLTGKVWDYEFPFPLNLLGKFILEPLALYLNRAVKNVFAMSDSTKQDLIKHGFTTNSLQVIPEATDLEGLPKGNAPKKDKTFSVVVFGGGLRKMKRPEDAIKGFAHGLRGKNAKLVLSAGTSPERKSELLNLAQSLGILQQVEWTGRLSNEEKRKLFERSHVISMTSIKEGWGLVIMEGGLFEMVGLVYNVDGLRDAVINKKTGIIVTDGDTKKYGAALKFLYEHPEITQRLAKEARTFNEQFNFEATYEAVKKELIK